MLRADSERSTPAGRTGRSAWTTDSGTTRLARPAAEVVDGERRGRRQEDQLDGHGGDVLPRPRVEQREEALREHPRLRHAAFPAMYARVSSPASTPAIFSATYDSMVVERSGGPSHQFDHVPSSRRRARRSFASLRSVAGSRSPSTCSQKRCSATIVAFDSSSPTHQPWASWSSSSRATPASIVRSSVVCRLQRSSSHLRVRACQRTGRCYTAAHRSLHRRRPAGLDPGARADDVRAAGLGGRPHDARAQRKRRLRLPADARPDELGRAEPLDELAGDRDPRAPDRGSPSAPVRRSTPPSNTDAPRRVRAR